jgi:pimeloyl-ACP methyl ester carboxylesterase
MSSQPEAAADHSESDIIRYTMSDGVTLVAEAWGKETDPPIIFAHGGGQTRYAWSNVAKRVADLGWRSIAVDLRGHGESDWSKDSNYHHDRYAEDLREIARSLPSPPVIVGASLGGNSAMLAAGYSTENLFRALVIVDITPRREAAGLERIFSFMNRHIDEGFASPEDAAKAIAGYTTERKREPNVASLSRYLRMRPDGRYRWHWDPNFIRGKRTALLSEEAAEYLAESVRRIKIPILLVRGGSSDIVSEEGVREFLDLAPHADFEDVAGAGHMIVGDRNDAFARSLATFLDKLKAGTARSAKT